MESFTAKLLDWLKDFGIKTALIVTTLVVGLLLLKLVAVIIRKIAIKTKMDNAVMRFVISLSKALIWLITGFLIGYFIGIPIAALVAIVTAATVAIGLALQGSLSNLASGIVIAVTKPFAEQDFIEVGAVSGKIVDIKLFTTHLVTIDNKRIIIPNSTISSSNIINYTAQSMRMLNMTLPVAYGSDTSKVRDVLLDLVMKEPRINMEIAQPMAEVHSYGESGINFVLRAWTNTQDYWSVLWAMNDRILSAFRENSIEIPFNKMDVYLRNNIKDSA